MSSIFFLLLGKNNTVTSFHITQVGLQNLGGSDILENFSRNGGYLVLARSHSIIIDLCSHEKKNTGIKQGLAEMSALIVSASRSMR